MANVGALREAVRTSNISLVKRLVKGGVCVDERLWYGRTLLQECVTLSDVDMVKSLIEYGAANVNAQNDDGKTALHIASRAGALNIVCLLLDAGAQTDIQCLDGTTSLHLAMWKNKSQVVERLIKAGANPNLQDQDHWTPLHWGVQNCNLELVKLLVENGANMDVVNKSLLTPFTLSLKICCFPIAKYMLFMGAGVRIINETTKIPKSVISLLLRPEVVTKQEIDVCKFVILLIENGYDLWHDAELQSSRVMTDKKCETIRQSILSQISDPPKLLNICRNQVWKLMHYKSIRIHFSKAVRSLQIPTHLQDFLLIRAELQFEQLVKNSSRMANKFCTNPSSSPELKKTGIIRLKKASCLIPARNQVAMLEQQKHPSTSKCNELVNDLPKKIVPTRIVFNELSKKIIPPRIVCKDLPKQKIVPSRIVFDDPSKKKVIPPRIVFNDPPKKKIIPTKIVFDDPSKEKILTSRIVLNNSSKEKVIPQRIVFNDSPKEKIIPSRIVFDDPPKKKVIPPRIIFDDSPKEKIIATRIVSDDPSKEKILPSRIVLNGSSKEKNIPTKIVCNDPPKKMIPTRIVFNDQPKIILNKQSQTTEVTSFIKCQEKHLHPQPISNQNMSRILKTPSLNDQQRTPCETEGVKKEILKDVLSRDASNKTILISDKVRKLCRLNFDVMSANTDVSRDERHATKRRAWKTEEPLTKQIKTV